MKGRLKTAVLVLIAAALAAGWFWYYRPADVHTLSPDLAPVLIDISILRNGGGGDLQNSHLRYEKGDEGFEEALAEIEALRFRRPPTNLLFQALPFLTELGPRVYSIDSYDYHIYIGLANEDSTS